MAGSIRLEAAPGDQIAFVRIDNPGARNAISSKMWRELAAIAGDFSSRKDLRAVVVRGSEGHFSAGADISDFHEGRSTPAAAQSYDDLVESTCAALEQVPQPIIALIEGFCFGAGSSVAASCDLRVAADNAKFAVPAARLGLGYDVRGISRFLRTFGHSATAQLLLTADTLPAVRAHALGGVHVLAAPSEVEGAAMALAQRIASNAPLTLRAAKRALAGLSRNDAALTDLARDLGLVADGSADYREGRTAFAEKRQPRFEGR